MVGADDDSAKWAAQLAELLASQAATVAELFSLLFAESFDAQADNDPVGDNAAWVRTAERLEALCRRFLEDQTEAIVAAWPDFVRDVTLLLPLVGRGQPLLAMLAQLLPLLAGPELLGRAIESRGESLVKGLEHFIADLCHGQIAHADSECTADSKGAEETAGDFSEVDGPFGLDRTLP